MTVGQAILSPTRQWPILIKRIMLNLKETDSLHMLHGISMNTGGGATKIKNVGTGGVCYEKTMPLAPAIFCLIYRQSGEKWQDMYVNFNMGIGIDVVGEDNPDFHLALEKASFSTGIGLYELGRVTANSDPHKNKVMLSTSEGAQSY